MKLRWIVVSALVAVALLTSCSSSDPSSDGTAREAPSPTGDDDVAATGAREAPRDEALAFLLERGLVPYAERDLSSPEATISAFFADVREGDFASSFLLLHPATQRSLLRAINTQDPAGILTPEGVGAAFGEFTRGDHLPGAVHGFALIMEAGAVGGTLAVDLYGVDASSLTVTASAADAATVLIGDEAQLEVLLQPSLSGRWRIVQIREPGAPDDVVPFAAAGAGGSTPVERSNLRTIHDKLRADTPEAAAELAANLWAAHDFIDLFHLLHFEAQREVARGALNVSPDGLVPFGAWTGTLNIGQNEHDDAFAALFEVVVGAAQRDSKGYFDLSGAEVGQATVSGDTAEVDLHTADGTVTLSLIQDSTGSWRIRRFAEEGAPADRSPIGGTEMNLPEGTSDCWRFAAYDCDSWSETTPLDESQQEQIADWMAIAESDPSRAAEAASEIAAIRSETGGSFGDPEDVIWICRVMQGLETHDGRSLDVDPEVLAVELCPGDPSLITP